MTAPKEIFVDWEYNEDKPHVTINDENALPDENDVKYILATHATSPEYLSTLPAEVLEKVGWVKVDCENMIEGGCAADHKKCRFGCIDLIQANSQ
jgi:hypothetical protein